MPSEMPFVSLHGFWLKGGKIQQTTVENIDLPGNLITLEMFNITDFEVQTINKYHYTTYLKCTFWLANCGIRWSVISL